jgi:hypothetical protein
VSIFFVYPFTTHILNRNCTEHRFQVAIKPDADSGRGTGNSCAYFRGGMIRKRMPLSHSRQCNPGQKKKQPDGGLEFQDLHHISVENTRKFSGPPRTLPHIPHLSPLDKGGIKGGIDYLQRNPLQYSISGYSFLNLLIM